MRVRERERKVEKREEGESPVSRVQLQPFLLALSLSPSLPITFASFLSPFSAFGSRATHSRSNSNERCWTCRQAGRQDIMHAVYTYTRS